MKYNITLNQPSMIENNLNISQWCILDIISVAPTWCDAIPKDNDVYYWVARQKISEELKALDLKPDTVYRYIKQLAELGFINHIKDGKKDLINLTKKGKNLFVTMSEKNPNYYVGKKSEQNSEKNPTYNNTNSNNNTYKVSLKIPKAFNGFSYPEAFENLWKLYKEGTKSTAYKSYVKVAQIKDNTICLKEEYVKPLKDILEVENAKTEYKRHLSTILNLDIIAEYESLSKQPKQQSFTNGTVVNKDMMSQLIGSK